MIIEIHSHGSHFVRPLHGETVQLFVFSRQRSESSFIHRISANCVPTERLSHSTEEDFLPPPPAAENLFDVSLRLCFPFPMRTLVVP